MATIVVILLTIVYLIIIIPTIMMAIAHMADNNGEIGAAFRFREILNKIASLGWNNFIKWSVITIIPVVVIIITAIYVTTYISIIIQVPLEKFLVALVITFIHVFI